MDCHLNYTLVCLSLNFLQEINPGYSLEGLMLKLKRQYFAHLMQRAPIGKDSDVGKD